MIDAARALPLLRSAAQSWEWRTPDSELPPWVKKAVGRFAEWGTLVDAQIALLTQYLGQVRSYLPKGTKLSDTTSAVRDALTAAIEAGHAPDEREQFEQMITHAEAQDWRAVDRLGERSGQGQLSRPAAAQQAAQIIAAVRDRGAGLTVIRDFLADSDTWLTEALQAARMRGGGAGAAALTRVQDLLRSVGRDQRQEPGVSSGPSVLEKAQAMTAEAARLREGEKGEQDAARVSQRVDEVTVALQGLGRVVGAVDRLHAVSGTRTVDLSGLDEGRATFARHAAGRAAVQPGLHGRQAEDQRRHLAGQRATRRRLGAVDVGTTGRAAVDTHPAAGCRRAEIGPGAPRRTAEARENTGSVERGCRHVPVNGRTPAGYAQRGCPDPPPEILALLQRLGERPPMTLDQLTDDDIGLLRRAGIADQIEVRRRGM